MYEDCAMNSSSFAPTPDRPPSDWNNASGTTTAYLAAAMHFERLGVRSFSHVASRNRLPLAEARESASSNCARGGASSRLASTYSSRLATPRDNAGANDGLGLG